jgi:NAD(P)-dependent dehydrogenase (short-subunit alcohol dehydrogenase family)
LFFFYEQCCHVYRVYLEISIQYTRSVKNNPNGESKMSTKIAIVTGGSRGLGKNAALKLAKAGVDVILTYHSKSAEANDVVKQIESMGRRATALQLDVGSSGTFAAFAEHLKSELARCWQRQQFDFLLNNAGSGVHASFVDTTEAQFDQLVNIHLKSAFFLTQALLPLLANGGRILNVSSGLARFALPGYCAYGTMKGAVEVLTKYLAKELGGRGISVNVLAPGAIETDFGGGQVRDNRELNQMIASQTALGRAGLPDDIGGVVASLFVGDNAWITGQRIEASGGMFL